LYRISVDTGGTFTDVVVKDASSQIYMSKALTTRDRAYLAIEQGLADIAATIGVDVADLIRQSVQINYGTTRSTNMVVTSRTAKTALLVTDGFPDILLLREGGKPDPFRRMHFRPPLVPRHLTFEIDERILADGSVHIPLDEDSVRRAAKACTVAGIEAVGISLLWSIANPTHELRIAQILADEMPGIPVTLSHEVNPSIREYRRASSTAIDASLKPSMQKFFGDLQSDLNAAGFTGSLLISTSYGGGWSADRIAAKPVYSIGSGPSLAPVAAVREVNQDVPGGAAGNTVLVTDMGGTTFDLSVIQAGRIERTNETWLGGKWIGDITGTRSVDIESIGAGGGSIIRIDSGGLMQVGPQSAGSEPGPVCYGRGGSDPTITDAALVLGYLDSSNFLGGRLELKKADAEAAIAAVAERLGMTTEAAAIAAMRISVDNIVTAIREKTVSKGIDTREIVLVAGGGAAGINVGLVAAELGARTVILPKSAGAMSAYGAAHSDILSEFDIVTFQTTGSPEFQLINDAFAQVHRQGQEFLDSIDPVTISSTDIEFYLQARYPMQAWELTVSLGNFDDARAITAADIEARFHVEHERVFGVFEEGEHVEILGYGARATARLAGNDAPNVFIDQPAVAAVEEMRPTYFRDTGWVDARLVSAQHMRELGEIAGPAIVREDTTTLVVYPGQRLQILASGNYQLHIAADGGNA
jgi:N-methylhydantoinase A